MKKYLQIAACTLLTAMVMVSCTNREREIATHAQAFLKAYFNIDSKAASTLCNKELGMEIKKSLQSIDSLEPAVRKMLEKQSKGAVTEIISVDAKRKDTATVLYKVTLPNSPKTIENTLSLVKADKKWWVVGLGSK